MSITSAFNNAFSGLSVSSRRAELISNNISNALTEGFARREIQVSSVVLGGEGGGARVVEVARSENSILTSSRREADASASSSRTLASFSTRMADRLGMPGEMGALAVQFSELEASFLGAANDPGNDSRLAEVIRNLNEVAGSLNDKSAFVNQLRFEADQEIANQVSVVNQTLQQLSDLNAQIKERTVAGSPINALVDQQGQLLDQLNVIVPVKVVPRDFGQIAVFTPSGGALLDGTVSNFAFSSVPVISHAMTLANGSLSDLEVNGAVESMSSGNRLYRGGSLEALFKVRDESLPLINAELDGLSYDLVMRFQDPSVDTSLAIGDPGALTDGGAAAVVGNIVGLAGRISVNTALSAANGGPWKLRSGLNATVPSEIGDNSILRNYQSAVSSDRIPSVGITATNSMSSTEFVEHFASKVIVSSNFESEVHAFDSSKSIQLKSAESSAIGVDSDRELQSLIEVEAAYAANARVMSVLEDLLNKLLEI